MAENTCSHCSKIFKAKGTEQKYCSKECYHSSMITKECINCKGCGKEVVLIKSRAAVSTKYCKQCFPQYCKTISESRKKPVNKRAETDKKICIGCNNEFVYRINHKREKLYCTNECAEKHRKPMTHEQRLKGIEVRSKSEKWLNYVDSITGENNKRYTGNRIGRTQNGKLTTWRKAVFMRDDYTCQHCNQKGGRLEAHHIKEYSKYPELRTEVTNGLTLCYDCHNKVHGKMKRDKTYHCVICGIQKTSGRSPMCQSCGAKNRKINYGQNKVS